MFKSILDNLIQAKEAIEKDNFNGGKLRLGELLFGDVIPKTRAYANLRFQIEEAMKFCETSNKAKSLDKVDKAIKEEIKLLECLKSGIPLEDL